MAGDSGRPRNWKRILLTVLAAGLIVVGAFVLFPLSTLVDRNEIASGTFTGSVPADEQVVVPINLTEVGFIQLEGEVLPCSLSIGAFTVLEVIDFNETHIFPRGSIDCQNRFALFEVPATHVVFLNEHPTDALGYRVHATYFTATFPYAWTAWAALGLIVAGGVLIVLLLLRRFE